MIFADRCGRECEIITSCDNYQNRAFCDFHCEQNCYCPDGMVEHNGECVDPSMCPGMTISFQCNGCYNHNNLLLCHIIMSCIMRTWLVFFDIVHTPYIYFKQQTPSQ